jgi:tetratricopeptide (TPR) repeat protein
MKPRLLLIGWDAADWGFLQPLIDRGLMPALAALRDRGAWGNLATIHPALSPMLWTSIATGVRPERHGILGFVEPDPSGAGARPVRSTSRRVKALWNILHQSGLTTNVVGWYAGFPAEPVRGCIVSGGFESPSSPRPPSESEPWAMPGGTVHPASLAETISSLRVHPTELSGDALLPFVPRAREIDTSTDLRLAELRKLLAQCVSVHAAATHLLEHTPWDATLVYHEAFDRFAHTFMPYHRVRPDDEPMPGVSRDDAELYGEVMTGCARFHDMMLERLLALAGPDTTVLLVSDHGYQHDHRRPALDAGPLEWHRPLGIAVLAGPGVEPGRRLAGASVLDVTPTALACLELPAARDMDGRPWGEVFRAPIPGPIDSWELAPGDAALHPDDLRVDPEASRQAVRQLVELGYLPEPEGDAGEQAAQAADIGAYNRAVALCDAGRPAEALPIFRDLRTRDPRSVSLAMHLALAAAYAGEHDEARAIAQDLAGSERPPPRAFLMLGTLELIDGRPDAALSPLRSAEAVDPRLPGLALRLVQAYLRLGRVPDAERVAQDALNFNPDSPALHDARAEVFLASGEAIEAERHARAACDLAPHFPRARFRLAQALAAQGRVREAADACEACLVQAPTHTPARELAARLYARLGDDRAALQHRIALGLGKR